MSVTRPRPPYTTTAAVLSSDPAPSPLDPHEDRGEQFPRRRRRQVDRYGVETAVRALLTAIGEDPTRPGLVETPGRIAAFYADWLDGQAGALTTSFEELNHGRYVLVERMKVWALCEHHLLPFWTTLTVAYVPAARVLGLSKFGRIARHFARRDLQLQERLITEIAHYTQAVIGSPSVAVAGTGEHLCMTMRGVEMGHRMTSVAFSGAFSHRNEFAHGGELAPVWDAAVDRLVRAS